MYDLPCKGAKMKVCKIEDFPGDKVECRNCRFAVYKGSSPIHCLLLSIDSSDTMWALCPSKGCRDDCPLIPCEEIKGDLEGLNDMVLYEGSVYKINDDSIKFIKACEDK